MTRTRTSWAGAAVAALVAGSLGAVGAPAASAAAPDQLRVDFSQRTGEFRGGASGTLYGLGDEGAPTQALINGAHITNTSQKAPFGTQHPSGDALTVEDGFFDKHGEDMYVYVQDYYPDWAYNGGRRPDDTRTYDQSTGAFTETPNGTWDYLEVVRLVAEAVATRSERPEDYVFIPFNEPDGGNWYADWTTMEQPFLEDWDATYEVVQEVYAKHGLGHARIGGPGDTRWQPERSEDILVHAKAAGTLPDIFIWHELGIDNLRTFRSHFAEYRALETRLGIAPIHVNITEWGMLRDMSTPGQLVQWFSIMEDLKVDGQVAYWNYAGNLSDNSARTSSANGGWWMFKWYGDLEGAQTVAVTPPALDAVDTLQAIGAVDVDDKRATVLLGGGDDPVDLDLSGLDPATFGTSVDVEVRETRLTGAEGLAGTPRVVSAQKGVPLDGGDLDLAVSTYDRYSGYQVVITPAQDRDVVTDPVWSATVEAEDTALTAATAYTQDPLQGGGWKFLASHGKDVGSFNSAASTADWTVDVPRTGTYRFQVIGSTPGVPGRHALFVDGASSATVQYAADLALNATSRWQYRGSAEVTIPLTAGEHVLSLRASQDGTSVLANSDITLDAFSLTDVTDGAPVTYPASTLRLVGGATSTWDDGVRGWAQIAGAGQRADAYVTAWDSGYQDVAVTYRTAGAATVDLDVNGRSVATLSAAGEGTWTSTARVHLPQGINEVELSSAAGALVQQLVTTRVTSADTAAITVEAEDGVRAGGAVVNTYTTASGSNVSGRAVGGVGTNTARTLTIPRGAGFDAPGDYDVAVTYANAEVQGSHEYNPQVVDRRLEITEAGAARPAGYGYFRYTYSWDSFLERNIPVTLTTGDAGLVLGNPTGWAPDIDKIVIAPVRLGEPTTTAAVEASVVPVVEASVTGDAPGDGGWFRSAASVDLALRAGEGQVEHRVDGGASWQPTTGPVTTSADGAHTVSYRVSRDGAPVGGSDGSVEVKIDATAPTTSVQTDPASGTAKGGEAITAAFTASDATSGVARTEHTLDGGAWAPVPRGGVVVRDVGAHTVQYRSVDTAGNVEATREVVLTVAAPATVAAATTTSADQPSTDGWYQQPVVVALKAPGTQKIQYRVDGGAWKSYSASLQITKAGTTTIDHRLVVGGGPVQGSLAQTQIKVDKTAPTATVVKSPDVSSGTTRNPLTIMATGLDALSGLARLEYRVNQGGWLPYTAPVVVTEAGDHVISVRSTDHAGNASAVKTTTLTIKAAPAPAVTVTGTPRAGAVVTVAVTGLPRYDDAAFTIAGRPLGTTLTDVNGSAKVTYRLPADVATGATTLVATAPDGTTASRPVTVK